MNSDSKLKQYLVKGTKILAVGELKTEKWKDKDGVDKSSIKISIRNLELVGNKQEQTTNQAPVANDDDDDLPNFLR
jgi:single-stranded DNA-binding protein